MDSRTKARVQLLLRGERAWGLSQAPAAWTKALAAARQAASSAARHTAPATARPPTPAPFPVSQARQRVVAALAQPPADLPPKPASPSAADMADKEFMRSFEPTKSMISAEEGTQPDWPPFAGPQMSDEQKAAALAELDRTQVTGCTRCPLCQTRDKTVFGEGAVSPRVLFIGEAPGGDEDATGRPFVGRAGGMLDRWIVGIGLKRQDVYITNIVKCRPPENREPEALEVKTCTPYLLKQLEIIRPKFIVTLGIPAAHYMLRIRKPMGQMHGRWFNWRGIQLLPTYHPSYLLRTYTDVNRATIWADLQMLAEALGLPRRAGKAGE